MKTKIALLSAVILGMFISCRDLSAPAGIELEAEVNPGDRVNLCVNGGFENGEDYPDQWFPDGWSKPFSASWETGAAPEGSKYIRINNHNLNDVRWMQYVRIEPYTDYVLSALIKTEGVDCRDEIIQTGATVGIYATNLMSPPLLGSHEWTRVSFRFNSRGEEVIKIVCRLGTWSGRATGTALFDDVKLCREP